MRYVPAQARTDADAAVAPGAKRPFRRTPWTRRLCAALGTCFAVAGLSACGRSAQTTRDALLEIPVPANVTVRAEKIAGLGVVLTDAQGHALYMFPPDAGSRVSCLGPCAGTWPPLVVADGGKATAGAGVDAQDLATLADPNTGARIITYGGFPLYRYAGDVSAGTANGQGLFLDGGPWYTLTPDAQPITSTPGGD